MMNTFRPSLRSYLTCFALVFLWSTILFSQQSETYELLERVQGAYGDDIEVPKQIKNLLLDLESLENTFTKSQSEATLQPMELKGELVLEGELVVQSFSSHTGSTIRYEKNLMIVSEEEIFIGGNIIGNISQSSDEGNIVLKSAKKIVLSGNLLSASGADGTLQKSGSANLQGRDGGSIVLIAPEISIIGDIQLGDGGEGIAGQKGGDGGSLYLLGELEDMGEELFFYGGNGGKGGDGRLNEKPGTGGKGGDVVLDNSKAGGTTEVLETPVPPIGGGTGTPGTPGTPGTGSTGKNECSAAANATGGNGGDGGNGSGCSADGGDGGKGGTATGGNPPDDVSLFRTVCDCRGGNATGGDGGDGGNGGSCSNGESGKGGDGGNGGEGGAATGGKGQFPGGDGGWAWGGDGGNGGNGGKGGNGVPGVIKDNGEDGCEIEQYAGEGGDGGKGGDGGDGGRAQGGDGGDGEMVWTFCLSGGDGGDACPGAGGDGGDGGDGGNGGLGINDKCCGINLPSGEAGGKGLGGGAGDVAGGQAGKGGSGVAWGANGSNGEFGIEISGGGNGNNGNNTPGNTCGTDDGAAGGPGADGTKPGQVVISPPCEKEPEDTEVPVEHFGDDKQNDGSISRNNGNTTNTTVAENLSVTVHPNPNQGQFMLRVDKSLQGPVQIRIVNMQGAEIYRAKIGTIDQRTVWTNVQLENPSISGIYVIQVLFEEKTVNEKFVLIR